MIRIHKTPGILKWLYPSLTWERESENQIHLTFDDGPQPDVTNWILAELDKYDAKATFFCVGQNMEKYPDIVKETISRGHKVANHTFDHLKGWTTDDAQYISNISKCDRHLTVVKGSEKNLFRPPYGRIRRSQIKALTDNYEIIMWSHLSWDFDVNVNIRGSLTHLKKAESGSILVFHDNEKSFKNVKSMLPELLVFYNERKYKFSTL